MHVWINAEYFVFNRCMIVSQLLVCMFCALKAIMWWRFWNTICKQTFITRPKWWHKPIYFHLYLYVCHCLWSALIQQVPSPLTDMLIRWDLASSQYKCDGKWFELHAKPLLACNPLPFTWKSHPWGKVCVHVFMCACFLQTCALMWVPHALQNHKLTDTSSTIRVSVISSAYLDSPE